MKQVRTPFPSPSPTLQRKQSQTRALLSIKVPRDELPPFSFYDLGCGADNTYRRCGLRHAGAATFPCLCLFRSHSNITICLLFNFISLSLSLFFSFPRFFLRCKKETYHILEPICF